MSEIMKKFAEEDISLYITYLMGILTMLAHFYLINKGKRPFNLVINPAGIKEPASTAELNGEQVKFVKETAIMVNEKSK